METYYYEADGGSIMLGNSNFRACFSNFYGDGCHMVTVTADKISYPGYKFMGVVEGDGINVYNYDCLHDGFDEEANILCKLNGRYGVFAKDGNIVIQRWD